MFILLFRIIIWYSIIFGIRICFYGNNGDVMFMKIEFYIFKGKWLEFLGVLFEILFDLFRI